jgi:hypothetical protein
MDRIGQECAVKSDVEEILRRFGREEGAGSDPGEIRA